MQRAILDSAAILDERRETEARSENLECRACRQQFHHRRRRHYMFRPITVNHLACIEILHQYRHVRLSGYRLAGQEIDRQ